MQVEVAVAGNEPPETKRRAWVPWVMAVVLVVSLGLNALLFSHLRRVDERAVQGVITAATLTYANLLGAHFALKENEPQLDSAAISLAKAQAWAWAGHSYVHQTAGTPSLVGTRLGSLGWELNFYEMALGAVARGAGTPDDQAMVDRLVVALDEVGRPEDIRGPADLDAFSLWAENLHGLIYNWC